MKVVLLISIFLFVSVLGFSQDDFNKKDSQGRKQGKWVELHEKSSIKKYEGQFKDDKPFGEFRFWYESGKLRAYMNYTNNGITAKTEFYHENGKLMAAGTYINKVKDAEWKYYDNRERLSQKENYVNGKLEGERINYYIDGISIGSYVPNVVLRIENYKNGVLHGPFKQYYFDSAIKQEGTYLDGNYDGRLTYYYSNGRREKIETYKYAVKHGLFMVFDEEGTVKGKLFYQRGRLLEGKELERYLKHVEKK